METKFERAGAEDYEEVIDTANYVFSQAHRPHDFPVLLPKLYKRSYFMDAIHYVAREAGRIKAVIGAYPLDWELPGAVLPGRGIGMVAVHPYCRSRNYMKTLMTMALEDMKRDGAVFSGLGGQRQRYEYFGYAQAGIAYVFFCYETNIRHTLGRQWTTGLSLKPVASGDTALLDGIRELHEVKIARFRRNPERMFDILSSWKSKIFAVIEKDRFQGYIVAGDSAISEINMRDTSRLAECIALFLRDQNKTEVQVAAGPHETEKIAMLSRFAEGYTAGEAYNFAVFDYPRFLAPFLRLKSRLRTLPEGFFILEVKGGPRFALSVRNGSPEVCETDASPDAALEPLEVLPFLSSLPAESAFPGVRENPFLHSILPLPLFFESADRI